MKIHTLIIEIERLKREKINLEKEIENLAEKLAKEREQREDIERELKKYKNSNTPPSAHKHLKPNTQSAKKSRRLGAPKGHIGTTRSSKKGDWHRLIVAEGHTA